MHGSVLDAALVDALVRPADIVFHLAAAVGVKLIVDSPLDSLRTNIHGTEIVLDARTGTARRCWWPRPARSTARTRRRARRGRRPDPRLAADRRWSYAEAKAVDESLADAYWPEHGLPAVVVRLFNTVGPGRPAATAWWSPASSTRRCATSR